MKNNQYMIRNRQFTAVIFLLLFMILGCSLGSKPGENGDKKTIFIEKAKNSEELMSELKKINKVGEYEQTNLSTEKIIDNVMVAVASVTYTATGKPKVKIRITKHSSPSDAVDSIPQREALLKILSPNLEMKKAKISGYDYLFWKSSETNHFLACKGLFCFDTRYIPPSGESDELALPIMIIEGIESAGG